MLRAGRRVRAGDVEPVVTSTSTDLEVIGDLVDRRALDPALRPAVGGPCRRAASRSGRTRRPRRCATGRSGRDGSASNRSSSMICCARLSRWMPRAVNTWTSMTVPLVPGRRAATCPSRRPPSPKIARSSFSSGVSGVSPFGVTLPTSVSPGSPPRRCRRCRLVQARALRSTGSGCRA